MTRQVALLRGVNVGRNQRVAMSDLRDIATGLGWTEVSTHVGMSVPVVVCTLARPRPWCSNRRRLPWPP